MHVSINLTFLKGETLQNHCLWGRSIITSLAFFWAFLGPWTLRSPKDLHPHFPLLRLPLFQWQLSSLTHDNEFWMVFFFFLSGTFNDLDHHQIAALASCFIPGDKSSEQIQLRTELARPLQQLQESARKIAEVLFHIASLYLSCTCMLFGNWTVINASTLIKKKMPLRCRFNMNANWI